MKVGRLLRVAWCGLLLLGSRGAAQAQGQQVGPFQFSGWVELYGSLNFEGAAQNALHVFDGPTGFRVNGVGLLFEKPVEPGQMGIRVDLVAGPLGDAVQGAQRIIQQAYVTLPLGEDITLDAGQFLTFAGGEVIEAHNNWNFTRSFLFGFAIPFFHVGLRVHAPLTETVHLTALAVNGWDVMDDNNRGKTLGLQGVWEASPRLTATVGWLGGPEQPGVESQWRHVVDVVIQYTASPSLAFLLNADYGTEENLGRWSGLALYGRYAWSERRALAVRAEYFNDRDNARGIGGHVNEVTFTYEHRPLENYLLRLEYRFDRSNQTLFNGRDNQSTLTLGVSVLF